MTSRCPLRICWTRFPGMLNRPTCRQLRRLRCTSQCGILGCGSGQHLTLGARTPSVTTHAKPPHCAPPAPRRARHGIRLTSRRPLPLCGSPGVLASGALSSLSGRGPESGGPEGRLTPPFRGRLTNGSTKTHRQTRGTELRPRHGLCT